MWFTYDTTYGSIRCTWEVQGEGDWGTEGSDETKLSDHIAVLYLMYAVYYCEVVYESVYPCVRAYLYFRLVIIFWSILYMLYVIIVYSVFIFNAMDK